MTRPPVISPCTVKELDGVVLLSNRGKIARHLTPCEARAVARQLDAAADIAERHRISTEMATRAVA